MQDKIYSVEEVTSASQEYFNGDDFASSTWMKKYCLKNDVMQYMEKTPEDMHHRLAKGFNDVEQRFISSYKGDKKEMSRYGQDREDLTEEKIFGLFDKFRYIVPGGSVMAGLGSNAIGSLSNCFVIGAVEDSYSQIMIVRNEQVQLMKRRGGVGLDLSLLRPRNSKVNNAALTSTGAASFMEVFSEVTKEVAQCGRRGALMLTMNIMHPDSEEFITKKQDLTKVTGANISVKLTDEFMQAVENDSDFFLRFPVNLEFDSERYQHLEYGELVNVSDDFESVKRAYLKKIKAKDLWNKLMSCAHGTGEPGIMFESEMHNYSPDGVYDNFKMVSTNPCQPARATVLTPNGIRTFGEISVGDTIWSKEGWTKIVRKECSGVKDVYNVKTDYGTFVGTLNHRLVTSSGKMEANVALDVEGLCGPYDSYEDIQQFIVDGYVFAAGLAKDGYIYVKAFDNISKTFLKDFIIDEKLNQSNEIEYIVNTTLSENELYAVSKAIPNRFFKGDKNEVSSFLKGFVAAFGNGDLNGIDLNIFTEGIRYQLQEMFSSIGITSKFIVNAGHEFMLTNVAQSIRLNFEGSNKFATLQNPNLSYKIKDTYSNGFHGIKEKVYASTEEVFNITVDNESHTYWTGGLNVSNCGEIGMGAYDSCRLIHLNLSSYVIEPFTSNAHLDLELLYKHAYEATRLADDLVELEVEAVDRIIDVVKEDSDQVEYKLWNNIKRTAQLGRRCGLGFTAMADTIAMLGLKYDSEAGLLCVDAIMKTIFNGELDSTIDMAIERGTFLGYDRQKESNGNKWYEFVKNTNHIRYERMMKFGRRNVSFGTVAPTGTVSIMTKTTSGIEPLFMPYYVRRRKCMTDSDRVDFVDVVGEKYTEFVVVHPMLRKYAEDRHGIETVNEWKIDEWQNCYSNSPWFGSTANDINWENRVRLQGIVQKYITHSISSTVNLPNNVTVDDVSNIYYNTWKNHLKGITVYRDGCRSGVLVSADTKKEDKKSKICVESTDAPKRPKILECKIYRFSNKGEKWVGVVGLLDGKPYEIFTGLAEKLNIPTWVENGIVVRNKEKKMIDGEEKLVSRYDICYKDKDGFNVCVEGLSRTFNPEFWNYAKLISGLLRHKMPIPYVIKVISSLNLDSSTINTWKNGVIRTLRKFNDSIVGDNDKCPECGGRMVRENGCLHCIDCGWSRCE